MIGIRQIGARQIAVKLDRLARADLKKANLRSVEFSARIVETDLKQHRFSGRPVGVRSGVTRNSIRTQINPNVPSARVGTPLRHVPGLETGITIRAKRAKYLTIPLRAAQTTTGRSRGDARTVGARYQSTFFARSRRGNLILFGKRSKKGKPVPLFVLKKQVKIKARRPFAISVARTRIGVVRKFDQEIGRVLR